MSDEELYSAISRELDTAKNSIKLSAVDKDWREYVIWVSGELVRKKAVFQATLPRRNGLRNDLQELVLAAREAFIHSKASQYAYAAIIEAIATRIRFILTEPNHTERGPVSISDMKN